VAGQGGALCRWDAAEVVTIPAAPPAGNTRVDVIIAQVRDPQLDAGVNNDFIFTSVTGTASTGIPAVPAIPANAAAVANVLVPAAVANLNTATVTPRPPPLGGQLAVPAGRAFGSAAAGTTANAWALFTGLGTASYLRGGVTLGGNVLTVPVAGVYGFTGSYRTNSGLTITSLGVGIWKNGAWLTGNSPWPSGTVAPSTQGGVVITYADTVVCAAGDTLGLAIFSAGNGTLSDVAFPQHTNVSTWLITP
jgi:hypothetical protein